MEQFKFHEVVIGIIVGDIEEGTKFKTSTGFDAVYKNGMLSWVTSGGYIGSPIAVTQEILGETFSVPNPTEIKELSFFEAMQYLAEGDAVTLDMGHGEYKLEKLKDLDDVVTLHEYFSDIYKGRYYVELESAEEVLDVPFSDEPESEDTAFAKTAPLGRKLSKQEAWEILNKYHFTKQTVEQLANRYAVSARMIYYILDGTHWKEVHKLFHTDYDVVKDDYIK